jgi:penicillin-binding protein 1A
LIRFITSFFGGLFSWVVTALFFGALVVGAVFWVYSRDLPDYESLANYTPKTISRIYSGEGKLMDEFATERRIFAPIEDVPDVVKWAFISAEDKNFYTHKGFDARGIIAAAFEAVKSRGKNVRGASTITAAGDAKNFLLSRRPHCRAQDQGTDPVDAAGAGAAQGQDP